MRRAARLLGLALCFLAPGAARAQIPPCAACAFVVSPGTDPALLPDSLNGLTVLVRADGRSADPLRMLDAIAERGGVPGAIVGAVTPPLAVAGRARVVLVDARDLEGTPEALAFTLKRTLTELRARSTGSLTLGLILNDTQVEDAVAYGLASYLDALATRGPIGRRTTGRRERSGVDRWALAGTLGRAGDALERSRRGDADAWIWTVPAAPLSARSLLDDLARAAALFPRGLARVAGPDLACGGRVVETFLNPATLERVAHAAGCEPHDGVTSEEPVERTPLVSGGALLRLPAPQGQIAERVAVSGHVLLGVAEVIARHQAALARQAALVQSLISHGSMTLTFEAPGFAAPVTIASATTLYRDRARTEFAQRDIRVNGLAFETHGGLPRLPLLEPERVASPPLTISLTDDYAYSLDGRESVGGVSCYVVSFEPKHRRRTLFRGRAWIAADDFGLVRIAAAQTALRGPIVASQQVDEFSRLDRGVWVLTRSDVRQMYEGAAHRTPIHRRLVLAQHEVNRSDFNQRRSDTYQSDAIVLRDTSDGFRYVVRESLSARGGADPEAPPTRAPAASIRTLAFGAIVDPNISRPLPFAGVSYENFDLFKRGAQISAFFGGTYGQVAVSLPSVAGSRWQVGGRAFAIAKDFNDRAFREGREIYEENLRQRPAEAAVWLLRPIGVRAALRVGYGLHYTHLEAGPLTAPDFQSPPDQVAHGLRVSLEGQHDGWAGSIWWDGVRRAGWRPWGRRSGDGYERRHREYQRFGATVARSTILSPRLTLRTELAWMNGRDLDRFSRYTFGTFDNRLHGYPSALIRYDRGAVARAALAWPVASKFRLDGFADAAVVHDPGFGCGLSRLAGWGSAVEVPLPMGVLAAVEWGYGPQGVNADGGRGTHVVRISAFKVF